jgi:hypothetical protein
MSAEGVQEDSSFLKVAFDLGTERAGLLSLAGEYLEVGRQPLPAVVFYRGAERVMMVTSRPFDSEGDRERSIFEMLTLYSAMPNVETMLISFDVPSVTFKGGKDLPAVIVVIVKSSGAEAMVYPYEYINGKVAFDLEAELDAAVSKPYSSRFSHAFAVNAFMYESFGSVRSMISWLYSRGFEIQFFGEWGLDNIDAATRISIGERS